ncbi:MAG: phospho-N-acetylmuramoyl-pentapeptide-transferase [Clostridiales bacterium]|jgi:phospho-N-acetylmuramoyl-pentapeptide-transferase|nr:phospho-N-acetylmuramoyl-pentapeptide-transferase [Clostridiales bacterium]
MPEIAIAGLRSAVLAFLSVFAASVVCGLIFVPILRKLKFGQTIREDGPASHLKKAGTPTMGGVIFLIPIMAVLGAMAALGEDILPALLATAGFGIVGLVDDLLKIRRKSKDGLSALQKTAGLLAVAAAFASYMAFAREGAAAVVVPLTGMGGVAAMPVWLYLPFTVFVFYATTNAANLTDGVDGLAASVTLIASLALTAAALAGANGSGAAFSAAIAGGCLGFLVFNAHPAKVIMGDCGSLALGGAVAAAAMMMRAPWAILAFGGIYAIEALSDIIQVASYKMRRKRVFKMAPIHHHFELSGWSEAKVVLVFDAVSLVFCAAGLALLLAG